MHNSEFLTAEWRNLIMLNYEIEPGILLPRVPQGTELDFWNGKAYVSMVGFQFLNTRVLRLPIPFHQNFEEVNLRFYVRRKTEDGWRRGVVFVKELVPRFAIAVVARSVFNENYQSVHMDHFVDLGRSNVVEYRWYFQDQWNRLSVKCKGEAQPIVAGSAEEFISEHYWGYTTTRKNETAEYGVEHPRWLVRATSDSSLECSVAELYGEEFVDALRSQPESAFLAEGSEIVVRDASILLK